MQQLGLDIPSFKLKRCFAVDVKSDSLTIQGLDPSTKKNPYSFIKGVKVELRTLGSQFDLTKEPFFVKFPRNLVPLEEAPLKVHLTLAFQGHYGEPEVTIKHVVSDIGCTIFVLQFDVAAGEWQVEKQ